jgi:hypothetical protein
MGAPVKFLENNGMFNKEKNNNIHIIKKKRMMRQKLTNRET